MLLDEPLWSLLRPCVCHLHQHDVDTDGRFKKSVSGSRSMVTNIPAKSKRTRHDIQINKNNNQSARMSGSNSSKKNEPAAIPKRVSGVPTKDRNRLSFFSGQPLGSGSVLVPNRETLLCRWREVVPVGFKAMGYAIIVRFLRTPSSFSVQFDTTVPPCIVHSSRLALELHKEQPSP